MCNANGIFIPVETPIEEVIALEHKVNSLYSQLDNQDVVVKREIKKLFRLKFDLSRAKGRLERMKKGTL